MDGVDGDTPAALQVIVLVGQPPPFLLSAPSPLPSPDPLSSCAGRQDRANDKPLCASR